MLFAPPAYAMSALLEKKGLWNALEDATGIYVLIVLMIMVISIGVVVIDAIVNAVERVSALTVNLNGVKRWRGTKYARAVSY